MRKTMCTCQAQGPRPTLIDLGGGVQVGLAGIAEAFEHFYAEGLEPSPQLADELLAAIKARNYVARSAERTYKAALLREFDAYCAARA
jgi:hypothetical protein